MKGNIVVTGACGFIGANLCEELVARDNTIGGLDSNTARNNIPGVRYVAADISDKTSLQVLESADTVFHLAALANPRTCVKFPKQVFEVNVGGTFNVLSACKDGTRVVLMSTAATYGEPAHIPLSEDAPLLGTGAYAASKIMSEGICTFFPELKISVIRNFNSFGPRQELGYLLPTLIKQALVEKELVIWNDKPIRDYQYVSDTVKALIAVAENVSTISETMNLCSGQPKTAGEVAKAIADASGITWRSEGKQVSGPTQLYGDNGKLVRLTGWKPTVPFEEGIRRTLEWYRGEDTHV